MNVITLPTYEALTRLPLLRRAWKIVRHGGQTAGTDDVSLATFRQDVDGQLRTLAAELQAGRYAPRRVRSAFVRKESGRGRRKLAIPAVRDRVVQQALRLLLEPVLEPQFDDASFAYRPGRSPQEAMDRLQRHTASGFRWIVKTDIRDFFDSVPHDRLLARLAEVVPDREFRRQARAVLHSARGLLPRSCGVPQGSPLSPVLANFYLTPFDRAVAEGGFRLVRYADDLVLCTAERAEARAALEHARTQLSLLGLQLHPQKTRILDARRESFDVLGFRRNPGYVWPAPENITRFEDLIARLTTADRQRPDAEWVKLLNPPIAAFGSYYLRCDCGSLLKRLDGLIRERLSAGLKDAGQQVPATPAEWDRLKLIRLTGIAAARWSPKCHRGRRSYGYGGPDLRDPER